MPFKKAPQTRCSAYLLLVLVLLLQSQSPLHARPSTQPPSVALRTALSYVIVADAIGIDRNGTDMVVTFRPVRNLHNNETAEQLQIHIPVSAQSLLQIEQRYLLAYIKQRRIGKGDPPQYENFEGGPILSMAQGASPALFPYHASLERRLTADPEKSMRHPQVLINAIMDGLKLPMLVHKQFFLRELINWPALHAHLQDQQIKQLQTFFNQPWLTAAMRSAFYEPRQQLQEVLGIDLLHERAVATLANSFVDIDPLSAQPNLLLGMLGFLRSDGLPPPAPAVLARWFYGSHHLVAEQALLLLAKTDEQQARQAAEQALLSGALSERVSRSLQQALRRL